MPKSITERIIDYPQSAAGRASIYSTGATSTETTLADHVHDNTLGSGGQFDHDNLLGLTDDDHTQYLLADGTRTAQELRFDTTPTPSQTPGSLAWNVDRETLDLYQNGVTLQLGQEVHFYCYNDTGSTIPDGSVVMFDADHVHGASGNIHCKLAIGNGSVPATMILGLATEDIPDGGGGKVTFFGEVRGVNTSGLAVDDVLYVSPTTPGALTATAPTAPQLRYQIAVVTAVATNGRVFVRAIYSTTVTGADDVYVPGDVAQDGDHLRWDGTDARWEAEIAVTRHSIPSTLTYTVPALHHYNVAHPYLYVDGDLDVIGDVVIHNPGGKADSIVTTSTSYTASAADDYVIVSGISGNVTITLPLASDAQHAIEVIRQDATSYTVTVQGTSSQTINGETSQTLRQYDALKAVPVGTYWLIG